MISYISNNGRLGENISFIYGIFRFCKINDIDFKNIVIDINYQNVSLLKNQKRKYVFKESLEMFSNVRYIFKNLHPGYFRDFIIDDIKCTTDIARLYNYYKYNNFDKNQNIIFKDWWSLDDYFVNSDSNFDFRLLNLICRPNYIVKTLKNKYSHIFLKKTVAIHVRREDYIGMIHNNILTKDVMDNMQNYFKHKKIYTVKEVDDIINEYLKKDVNVLIFSDDVDWCNNNFNKYKNVYIINGNEDYEDMILMSMCDEVVRNPGSFFSQIPYILSRYNNVLI